jgi:hypothetical protein
VVVTAAAWIHRWTVGVWWSLIWYFYVHYRRFGYCMHATRRVVMWERMLSSSSSSTAVAEHMIPLLLGSRWYMRAFIQSPVFILDWLT